MHSQREINRRRDGQLSLVAGYGLAAVAAILALVCDALTGDIPGRVLIILIVMATAAGCAVFNGNRERRERPYRAGMVAMEETQERILGALAVLPAVEQRLCAVEQALADVPRYAEGVIDGVQWRLSAAEVQHGQDGA